MSFHTLCASRLSDELALSEVSVARFTITLIEIANETIQKSHISKTKIVLNDRKLITDKKQIADLLASTIFHNSSSQNYSKQFQAIKKQKEEREREKKKKKKKKLENSPQTTQKTTINLSHF